MTDRPCHDCGRAFVFDDDVPTGAVFFCRQDADKRIADRKFDQVPPKNFGATVPLTLLGSPVVVSSRVRLELADLGTFRPRAVRRSQ